MKSLFKNLLITAYSTFSKAKNKATYTYDWYKFTVKENHQKLIEGSVLDPDNHPYYKK